MKRNSILSEKVIIIGASEQGKVIADIVLSNGDEIVGFLDDDTSKKEMIGYQVLGVASDYKQYTECSFIVGIGNASIRERIANNMQGVKWYTAIHPTAIISKMGASIGEGTVVMAGAIVNPGANIGKHCIINSGSIVEHDNVIADYVHISVGAKLAGTVHVGERTWVGIGSVISNGVHVCADCMLGAGTVVVKDIVERGTYVGVPSRKVK